MDIDRRARAQSLARTYASDRDPWDRVEEYQRVLEYRGIHPNKGSSAVASALELPRSRIRPWFNGSKPDPVHAIETAESLGWLDAEPGKPVFRGLVVLHAWVYGGGSIRTEGYVPTFVISEGDPEQLCRDALTAVGVKTRVSRPSEARRAPELSPKENASILGRFLHGVLGAPLGEKNDDVDISLPEWLLEAPRETRLLWGRTYVSLRGTAIDPRRGYTLQVSEQRTEATRHAIGQLLKDLTHDELVTVGANILLRPAAADILDRIPSISN